ncbi:hypothetical protein O3M35_007150 [Rhynocoris fuscipes]|uniref:Uncharacterized protein n=1 Tax=Rhynocoris fuscipes TaxID=488301 RepID=A0AAW1D8B2_9HEMI
MLHQKEVFQTLRRLKTWLRSTMTEDRLLGLALLHIHRDIDVDIQKIIDRFASKKKKPSDRYHTLKYLFVQLNSDLKM